MAINLKKIQADLNHGDPQIQTFALMSITRLSPQLVDSAQEIQTVYDKLQSLVKSDNPDVVFLARKAINHIDQVFRPYFKELGEKAGERPRDPRELSREELLRIVSSDQDAKYLSALMMRFIDVGQPEDLSALSQFLNHPDDRVRSNAVEVFETLGSKSSVPHLLPLLSDRNNRVRGNAILALVKLGHTDLKRNIEEMLCMGMLSMRETAVYVLSRLKLPFVEELLIRASADPYDGVRLRATKALSAFLTRKSIVRLKQLMNDIDIDICEAAVESLRKIKKTHDAIKETQRRAKSAPPTEPAVPAPAASVVESAPVVEEALETPVESVTEVEEPSVEASDSEVLREIGTEIYQLCRLNEITHESLDNVFYEILRYQDFLRAYLVKKQKGTTSDVNPRAAIEQLRARIKQAFADLGRCAADLIHDGKLKVPDKHEASILALVSRLPNAAGSGEN